MFHLNSGALPSSERDVAALLQRAKNTRMMSMILLVMHVMMMMVAVLNLTTLEIWWMITVVALMYDVPPFPRFADLISK